MYTTETIDFYESHVEKYYEEWRTIDLLVPLLQSFVSKLPETPSILDIGCGPGVESKRLASIGARVTGIDLGTKSLELARKHAPEASFIEMDVRDLNFADSSFDGVLDSAVLFHFSDDEQTAILKNLIQLLKPCGLLLSIYATGNYSGLQRREFDGVEYTRYVNLKSIDGWIEKIRDSGF